MLFPPTSSTIKSPDRIRTNEGNLGAITVSYPKLKLPEVNPDRHSACTRFSACHISTLHGLSLSGVEKWRTLEGREGPDDSTRFPLPKEKSKRSALRCALFHGVGRPKGMKSFSNLEQHFT